jgi:hypothetical protein
MGTFYLLEISQFWQERNWSSRNPREEDEDATIM